MLNLFKSADTEMPVEVLNTRVKPHVRIINGALDESEDSSSGIILNGRIDIATLRFLQPDTSYQRPLADRRDIYEALKAGKVVPNIEVGVRGQDFTTEGDDYVIYSPAYIIDGWQRVGNALKLLEAIPHHPIRIFASIHFGTDEIWERHRFTELNSHVRRVSPSVHLRNMRDGSDAILTLYGISNSSREFSLFKRVCWSQSMRRDDLITALTLAKTAMILHSQKGGMDSSSPEKISLTLNKMAAQVGLQLFRKNVISFFGLINECWPFAAIEYRSTANQTKGTLLQTLARVFADHPCFWDSDERMFTVSADDRRKLSKFPINDPHIANLVGSGGKARHILYSHIIDHMNSGRRTQRLRSRFDRDDM